MSMLKLFHDVSCLFNLSCILFWLQVWHSLEAIQAQKLVTTPFPEEARNGQLQKYVVQHVYPVVYWMKILSGTFEICTRNFLKWWVFLQGLTCVASWLVLLFFLLIPLEVSVSWCLLFEYVLSKWNLTRKSRQLMLKSMTMSERTHVYLLHTYTSRASQPSQHLKD